MSKDDHDQQSGDYKVGYGKPPQHTRFKPGVSGNPKGRPKQTKDLEKLFDRELSKLVRINDGGESRTISKREAVVKTIVHASLQGNIRSQQLLVKLAGKSLDLEQFEVDAGDREALQAFLDVHENAS